MKNIFLFGLVMMVIAGSVSASDAQDSATYKLGFAKDCRAAADAKLIVSYTQTNCYDPKGTDQSKAIFANTKIKFNRYYGVIDKYRATCEEGRKITQFDVLLVMKGKQNGKSHYYIIDCPRMHQNKTDQARYFATKSNSFRTTCVCNDDVGGIYTSTQWENIQPFFHTDWKNSNFIFLKK